MPFLSSSFPFQEKERQPETALAEKVEFKPNGLNWDRLDIRVNVVPELARG
jgi:hypothetical protein